MKLNLSIIQDHLPAHCRSRKFGPENHTLHLSRPVFYEPERNFRENEFYLVHADSLTEPPAFQNLALLIVGGHRLPQKWINSGIEILYLENIQDLLQAFHIVNRIFNRFDQWDESLRNELENEIDFDIGRMLTCAGEILENNISVTDHGLQIILNTTVSLSDTGELQVETGMESFPLPLEVSEQIKTYCTLERKITVPYMSSMLNGSLRSYCYNLYPFGHFIGCISISEINRPFRDSDFPLADHFFAYFQKAFLKYLRSFQKKESVEITGIRKLLQHQPLTSEELQRFTLQPGEFWACFQLRADKKKDHMPKDYMYASLNALLPQRICSVIYHDEITGLIRFSKENEEITIHFFQDILGRMNYICGISNYFSSISQMDDYLLQADYAANEGTAHPKKGPLFFFKDQILSYMLRQCTGELPMESLYSPGLSALASYDESRHTEYLKTLNVFLKNEMGITSTARELYIHRSSLLKRLDKIKRLIPEDLSDSNVRLYYRICFAKMGI